MLVPRITEVRMLTQHSGLCYKLRMVHYYPFQNSQVLTKDITRMRHVLSSSKEMEEQLDVALKLYKCMQHNSYYSGTLNFLIIMEVLIFEVWPEKSVLNGQRPP